VCLPHRLIIRVVSEASEQQLDGVAY
jgi:hypothetical protein